MLNNINLEKILFLDIETVAQKSNFEELNDQFKNHWEHKAKFIAHNEETPEEIYERAGIYAEFGKIVCISVGVIRIENGEKKLHLKSFYNDDESILLVDFFEMLNKHYNRKDVFNLKINRNRLD